MQNNTEKIFDFVVIGAPKCGTTYTYQLLKEHPDVVISSSKDGVRGGYFLDRTTPKVRKYIEKISIGHTGKKIGEFREGYYLKGREMAEKLHNHNKDMKLVVCLRDPYERAFSAYKHISLLKNPEGDFMENEAEYNYILEKGYFHKHLLPFLETFPADQLLLLDFEDLKNNHSSYREQLYDFIGVSTEFVPSTEGKQLNDTRFKGTSIGRIMHNTVIPILDKFGLGRVLRSSKVFRSIFYQMATFVGKNSKIKKQELLSKKEFMKKIEGIYDEDWSNFEIKKPE